jgi:hypothetical protein
MSKSNISARLLPAPKIRAAALILNGPQSVARLDRILEDETAIDALSRLLTEAIEKRQAKDGRIDMRDVAAHVLAEMKRNPK